MNLSHLFSALLVAVIWPQPSFSQVTYPVKSQSASYPLKTQISPSQIINFNKVFRFGHFNPEQAIALRAQLLSLAEANDPVACYWLAKTYDWYEFGVGRESDTPIALIWYKKAANLNYLPATHFLYTAYFYGFMNIEKDYKESIKWLDRSLQIAPNEDKSWFLLEFARLSDPDQEDTKIELQKIIPRNTNNHLSYLRQAFNLSPNNTSVADYYGSSLYDIKHYSEALPIMKRSDNPYTWQKIGKMYEDGVGTKPDVSQALAWYKKMAIEGKKRENDLNPITFYGKREVYHLICLKKVMPKQAAPFYTPEDYQEVFGRWADKKCNYSPG